MRVLELAAVAILLLVFVCPLPAQSSCPWNAEIAVNGVRFPVQMDTHAGYRIFAFQSDGTIGYRLRGEFPYAAYMNFTIYEDRMLVGALTDYQIESNPGSVNPFTPGELVNAANRSYTVTVLPAGAVPDVSMPNPIFFPLPAHGSNLVTVALAQRIYLPEPQLDRFGGVAAPNIEPFLVSNPSTPAACPSGDFSEIIEQFGTLNINFATPLPRKGKIEFYRMPASHTPYSDGSEPLAKHDCTGYLAATLFPDKVAVIHLPKIPTFFDNTNTTAGTTFPDATDIDVRYVSLGSYGASVLLASDNENVAGPDIKKLADGSATFALIPSELPNFDDVKSKAEVLGYNVMPLAKQGQVSDVNPFLFYRNKRTRGDFAGSIQNVPCFQGQSLEHAPSKYAASPEYMGPYAPVGVECSASDFLNGSCGQ